MAKLEIDGEDLLLRRTRIEKALSFRGDQRFPLSSVQRVQEEDRIWSAVRDTPPVVPREQAGTFMPGLIMCGVRRTGAGWDTMAVAGSKPAVRVVFAAGCQYSRLFASVEDARSTVATILRALP